MDGPPALWIAPSTPPPPSSVGLAALTIASTFCSVMSPITSWIRSDTASGGGRGSPKACGWGLQACPFRERNEPVLVTEREIDAGQACPLAVRLEQLARLVCLDPPAA